MLLDINLRVFRRQHLPLAYGELLTEKVVGASAVQSFNFAPWILVYLFL